MEADIISNTIKDFIYCSSLTRTHRPRKVNTPPPPQHTHTPQVVWKFSKKILTLVCKVFSLDALRMAGQRVTMLSSSCVWVLALIVFFMFSLWMCGFFLGTLTSSHSPKTWLRGELVSKNDLNCLRYECVCMLVWCVGVLWATIWPCKVRHWQFFTFFQSVNAPFWRLRDQNSLVRLQII